MDIKDIPIKHDKNPILDSEHQLSALEFNAVVKNIINILGEKITQDEYDRLLLSGLIDDDVYYYIVESDEDTPGGGGEEGGDTPSVDDITITMTDATINNETLIMQNGTVSGEILIIS